MASFGSHTHVFNQIAVVLSHTSHPGNIGACARAMKNMGFYELVLLNPERYPDPVAVAMASSAGDVLNGIRITTTLSEALEPYHYIIGASARQRSLPWPLVDARDLAQSLVPKLTSPEAKVALLFGNETSGLSNEEMRACDMHVTIPTDDAYPSLNLAQAVQIICYELRMGFVASSCKGRPVPIDESEHAEDSYVKGIQASFGLKQGFYEHLEETLITLKMLNPRQPKLLMGRLKRIYDRCELDAIEVNILRGILSAVQKRIKSQESEEVL